VERYRLVEPLGKLFGGRRAPSFSADSFDGNVIFMRGTFRLGVRPKRFWRLLLGVVVAYAVAAQSLLIALGGFSLPAHAGEGVPAIELCLHDADGAPLSPPGNADHSGCTHCIFSLDRTR
jgi:hypothetical protein